MPNRSYSLSFKNKVLEYLKTHSGEETARHFKIDTRRIREWKKKAYQIESAVALNAEGNSMRLEGAGPKIKDQDVELVIVEFINEKRRHQLRVSRRMVMDRAKELFIQNNEPGKVCCTASRGWLQKFLKRNRFSLRRRKGVAQKDPEDLCPKIVSFILNVENLRKKCKFAPHQIVAMDETGVNFDMLDDTTIAPTGSKDVTLRSTGNEKNYFTVVLAARGDGTKLKPFIVFKNGQREVGKLQKQTAVKVSCSDNGWMNEPLTLNWLDQIYGKSLFAERLLVWDSFKAHLTDKVKKHVKKLNSKMAVIPGGCTKYIQAPDVSWTRPFKAFIKQKYDAWMAGDNDKEYTQARGNCPGGNLKAPSKQLVTKWVEESWHSISRDIIRDSFKSCGLTTAMDGTEDKDIHCLKEGEPCRAGWDILQNYRDGQFEAERSVFPGDDSYASDRIEIIGIEEEEDSDAESVVPDVEIVMEDPDVVSVA